VSFAEMVVAARVVRVLPQQLGLSRMIQDIKNIQIKVVAIG